jgi:hypothetical protein
MACFRVGAAPPAGGNGGGAAGGPGKPDAAPRQELALGLVLAAAGFAVLGMYL